MWEGGIRNTALLRHSFPTSPNPSLRRKVRGTFVHSFLVNFNKKAQSLREAYLLINVSNMHCIGHGNYFVWGISNAVLAPPPCSSTIRNWPLLPTCFARGSCMVLPLCSSLLSRHFPKILVHLHMSPLSV